MLINAKARLPSLPLFVVKLLRTLWPHALSWNKPSISFWLTALLARLRFPSAGSRSSRSGASRGLGGGETAFSMAAAKCQSG